MRKLLAALTLSLMASTAANAYTTVIVQQRPNVIVVPGNTYMAPVTTPCGTGSLRGTPMVCVTNSAPFPIIHLMARSSGITGVFTNGTDLLMQTPQHMIPPGGSVLVHISDGGNFCTYNIHVINAAGIGHDYYNENICLLSNIILPPY